MFIPPQEKRQEILPETEKTRWRPLQPQGGVVCGSRACGRVRVVQFERGGGKPRSGGDQEGVHPAGAVPPGRRRAEQRRHLLLRRARCREVVHFWCVSGIWIFNILHWRFTYSSLCLPPGSNRTSESNPGGVMFVRLQVQSTAGNIKAAGGLQLGATKATPTRDVWLVLSQERSAVNAE